MTSPFDTLDRLMDFARIVWWLKEIWRVEDDPAIKPYAQFLQSWQKFQPFHLN